MFIVLGVFFMTGMVALTIFSLYHTHFETIANERNNQMTNGIPEGINGLFQNC